MLQAVRANKQNLQALVRDLDPDAIALCEAPDLWKEFTAIARLAESAATLLARRVEEGETWRKSGFGSGRSDGRRGGHIDQRGEDTTRDLQARQEAPQDR